MSSGDKLPKYLVVAALTAAFGVWIWQLAGPSGTSEGRTVNVKVPKLSVLATNGKAAFDANCASCHGLNAAGSDKGPPLVHNVYNPGHHSDGAFFVAAKIGVRQHHWPYGDMPPQPRADDIQLTAIVQYVRELQVANGISYRPHRM